MPKESKGKSAVRGESSIDSPSRTGAKPYNKRSAPTTSNGPSSKSQHTSKKPRFEKPNPSGSSSSLPGASKIKASIRQTKRLLAKPNLAPGTKIEAERRLKSLESDLEVASRKQVEKSRASRYHRVKFVERQKLVRRIARCKRNLARLNSDKAAQDLDSEGEASDDDDEGYGNQRLKESKMSKEELTKMLRWLRELLQYVMQYPADLRYVALFPTAEEGPSPPDAKEKDKSRQMAYQHLERVKKAIDDGQISEEVEVELSSKHRTLKKLATSTGGSSNGTTPTTSQAKNKQKMAKKTDKTTKNKRKNEEPISDDDDESDEDAAGAGGVKGDDFFAQDSDDEE
ncbi:uncharacterized protein UMAG_01016 [Mycosarcoma maydis]|uniref:rRNA-processing protein EFG1 n=1 Tax=Mycosarcoma maydis TaxID=5270 RepID=EFG1P_MYCMD|nr:uncharacterized protein UMAG_01016 [Ustilago maydis 521]Q4PFU7.1 RecName: Full=rRNA-processing protein EFG1 [Ustilago maydis 521]KIS71105.1 hypothetical protein UMAG_01016 [Ustilago maydis 521]|eukprot:XP_011386995.1 hypothetical protein UMAG_01016 [Ustilago maydis 521]